LRIVEKAQATCPRALLGEGWREVVATEQWWNYLGSGFDLVFQGRFMNLDEGSFPYKDALN
jgi:hypothetical protein